MRVRTISPRLRPKSPEAQTASNRRWAGGSDSVWGSALASSLSGPVHINDEPGLSRPVEHASRGGKWFAGEQILLKKRAHGFHNALVKASRENGKESIGGVTGFDQRVP